MREPSPTSRRTLLRAAAGGLVLASLRAEPVAGERHALDTPAPMLPPVPAVLLTVGGPEGGPDEISVVWTFVLNGTPPQIGISVAHEHVAQKLVSEHRAFVLNVPVTGLVEAFDRVDMSSTRPADKFALSGLTRGRAVSVEAPTVEECPIHVECKVLQTVDLPPGRKVFFAEVSATTVAEGVCDESGMLLVHKVPFFGMTAGSGEFCTMGPAVGHIGKTRGVELGKYRY